MSKGIQTFCINDPCQDRVEASSKPQRVTRNGKLGPTASLVLHAIVVSDLTPSLYVRIRERQQFI